jgi:YfiH family protein
MFPLKATKTLNCDRVSHGFFGRLQPEDFGFAPPHPFNGDLVVGPETNKQIGENREKTADILGARHLIFPQQCHGTDVLFVDNATTNFPPADGFVTNQVGLGLGIVTADCVPLLFYGPSALNPLIGAVHGGWRGLFNGIIQKTVDIMINHGAKQSDIQVAIGPCIHQDAYQVDQDFYKNFMQTHPQAESCFITKNNHYYFDLIAFAIQQLKLADIHHIESIPHCTHNYQEDGYPYYSHRRDGLNNQGRNISAIALL